MHRPETKIKGGMDILCNKPIPWKPMHRIIWRCCQTILCLPLAPPVEWNLNTWVWNVVQAHEKSVTSYWSSLLIANLIADNGDPSRRNVQSKLADRIG
jgi:hypothetical protein